ncbi:hypothetical protein [Thermithiobacillus plumbiphilus]|uniref:Lipoprotein n=1 Tax=Thermithiobacillus plumbiphilus TaxID=1729899 RepID=A0ABU9D7G7_9PROT
MTKRIILKSLITALGLAPLAGCMSGGGQDQTPLFAATGLTGQSVSLASFSNPQPNIPAQCYIETSGGTQNACLYCHTDGLATATPPIGNNQAQSGLQLAYDFAPGMNVNHWENTLFPEKLRAIVLSLGQNPEAWDMQSYIRTDNWSEAYAQRGGDPKVWNAGTGAFQVFPALDPADLPAKADGFVRSASAAHGPFSDSQGAITGWRAINFMPYGIFTPQTGSVSGVYIRLPEAFMKDASGNYSLSVYQQNLDLLERAVQNRLEASDPAHYLGSAASVPVQAGLYPLGTEFAHPLHYVDAEADGSNAAISRFPGTRANRVKEVRYMTKWRDFDPAQAPAGGEEEEGGPGSVFLNADQGWIDNGAGWLLSAYIEDRGGRLRPQRGEELMQCFGCHSGLGQGAGFKSGVGGTVDSTWAFPRKFAGDAGWQEMNYFGYTHAAGASNSATPGAASVGDPVNHNKAQGEFGYFLSRVVGASLYGEMPAGIEAYLKGKITKANGYSADWPVLDSSDQADPQTILATQQLRQQLMREMVSRKDYLENGVIAGALLYPAKDTALAAAGRYRQVVASQRFTLGKDVFPATPYTFKYHRTADTAFTHANGRPYAQGEVISDRPIGVPTLINEIEGSFVVDYQPYLAFPSQFVTP